MTIEVHVGYCVRCKSKKTIKGAQKVEMPAKGGKTRPAIKGTCETCNTSIFKILPSKPKETPPEPPVVAQEPADEPKA